MSTLKTPTDLDDLDKMPEWTEEKGPKWAEEKKALQEEQQWSVLEEQKVRNDVLWLKNYGIIILLVTWVLAGIFLISLLIWAVHHLLPPQCLWLTPDQLSKIQSILFSGGMGAIVSSIIKTQLKKS